MSANQGPLTGLARLLAPPLLRGVLKQNPSDFRVDEVLGFEPDGMGPHGLFLLEKTGMTTGQLVGALSKITRVSERDIGYCGLKDKHAVTTQWVSLPLPPKHPPHTDPDWFAALPNGVRVVRWARHRKKIRRGIHQGNRFTLVIHHVTGEDAGFEQRLAILNLQGFPNYFAEQRFGHQGGNYDLLHKIGAIPAEQSAGVSRADRNWGLSTLRAEIFNQCLSQRLAEHSDVRAQVGDLAQLAGSHSRFLVTVDELARTQTRLAEGDVALTGPLWGEGISPAGGEIGLSEALMASQIMAQFGNEHGPKYWTQHLAAWRVEHDRRLLRAPLSDIYMAWHEAAGMRQLELNFTLDAGAYATALLRELIDLSPESGAAI
jgi:tRNA pseudouridine13 synthase